MKKHIKIAPEELASVDEVEARKNEHRHGIVARHAKCTCGGDVKLEEEVDESTAQKRKRLGPFAKVVDDHGLPEHTLRVRCTLCGRTVAETTFGAHIYRKDGG